MTKALQLDSILIFFVGLKDLDLESDLVHLKSVLVELSLPVQLSEMQALLEFSEVTPVDALCWQQAPD